MKQQRILSGITLGVLLLGRVAIGSVALADDASPSPSPTPNESASPSPSATPAPSESPSVSPSPAPSDSPEPSDSPAPSASPSAEPSASPEPSPAESATGVDPNQTGAGGCGGVVPDWVFNTESGTWAEADKDAFSCDKASGLWLSPKYYYDKRMGWYKLMPASAPKADYLLTVPEVIHTALGDLVVGSKDYQVAQALGLLNPADGITLGQTGPGSTNSARVADSGRSWVDLTSLVNVINSLQQTAKTGDVNAASNTQVGNASSGAANVLANLINLLASAWSWSNGSLNFFMQNIVGNQTGDLTLAPSEAATGGGGQLGTTPAGSPDLQVKAQATGNIVNNLGVVAQSGNAAATNNTGVGNVSSGNASAMANIVNLISSMITSGNSFFGVLNIFGNLNGDVLFPQGFLNGLTSSGTGQVAAGPGQTTVDNQTTNAVANNVFTGAASGSVKADSNTQAGNLASGTSGTTQSLFNLSNTSVFGDNAVLVLVNVLGHWVGKIMNLPGGSSESALLTGNATVGSAGTDSNGLTTSSQTSSHEAQIAQSAVGTITNNIGVAAQSGDATASGNTKVGDVTSGNAQAGASVANIFNSVLNLKHWFGVLVINVFGDWLGDVNHDSEAGNPSRAASGYGAGIPAPALASLATAGTNLPVAGTTAQSPSASSGPQVMAGESSGPVDGPTGATKVLAAHTATTAQPNAMQSGKNMSTLFGLSAIVMLVAGMLASIDRRLRRR
jgi:hypothetical protein